MKLPPSIEALLDQYERAGDELDKCDRILLTRVAHEACRLQHKADVRLLRDMGGFAVDQYLDELREAPLVVPSTEDEV